MRAGRSLAVLALLTACASGTRVHPRDRVNPRQFSVRAALAPVTTDDPLPMADWLPQNLDRPVVIRADEREVLLIDGPFRAIVRSGRIEVARDRTRLAIARWFSLPDDQWVFVTVDGVVVSSRGFTGTFETRAELPVGPHDRGESGVVAAAAVESADGRWWMLDEPAHPRALSVSWADNVIALRFYGRDRALAIASPGHALHSDDGARSFVRLRMDGDAALKIDATPNGTLVVQGLRDRWAIDRNGVFGRVLSEPPRAAMDETIVARARARWSEHVRRFVPIVQVNPLSPTSATVGDTTVAALSSMLAVFTRGQRPALLPLESAGVCALFPFGSSLATLCEEGTERSRLRLLRFNHAARASNEPASIEAIETPIVLRHTDVFASDGTAIAQQDYRQTAVRVWTPRRGWRTHPLSERYAVLDAADGQLFASSARGLFALRIDGDGDATVREIARFEHEQVGDEPGVRFQQALASSAHGSLRAWVIADADFSRCAVLLEDTEGASRIELPRCTQIQSVRFIDRRFGVVTTPDSFLVTRDARTWSTHARDVLTANGAVEELPDYRRRAGWQSTRPYVFDSAIIVPPAHRVTRDGREHTIARSRYSERDREDRSLSAPSAPEMTLRCTVRATRAEAPSAPRATTLLHGNTRVSIEPTSQSDALSVRWAIDGRERGAWRGARPWPIATEATWRVACSSDVGVVVERCVPLANSQALNESCQPWLLRAGSAAPIAVTLDRLPPSTSVVNTQCHWADNAWSFDLAHSPDEDTGLSQFQQRSEDGAMTLARDVVREGHFDAAMSVANSDWYWIERRADGGLHAVPYVSGVDTVLEPIDAISVCSNSDGPSIFLGPSSEILASVGDRRIPVELQLRMQSRRYCIEAAIDASTPALERDGAPQALALRAGPNGALRGTLTTLDARAHITRADVHCTAQIDALR